MLLLMTGLMAGLLSSCSDKSAEHPKNSGKEIFFDETLHNYGEILEDSDGTWSFAFKNLGDSAIIINRVRSTCGCTVPAWPRQPVEPGASGNITVKYNTAQSGTFLKSVYVYSSAANSPVKLQIKGRVVPAEE